MWGNDTGWIVSVLLAGSVGVVACGPRAVESTSSADAIDVSKGSKLSLALHGGPGPLASGQTITKASVTLSNVQLVDASGNTVALSSDAYTGDLVALQNKLGQIFPKQAIQAGSYSAMQFRLDGAWVEAHDAQGNATVYAAPGADTSQVPQSTSVQTLRFAGVDADDYAKCGLPQGGITVSGKSSLALEFPLAQSLQVKSGGTWVLKPRCRVVDQSTFSTLDVEFDLSNGATSFEKDWSKGFGVMLLDSNLVPVSQAALTESKSTAFRAHFAYLQSSDGPFVAALLPPAGYTLQSSVCFSIDLEPSASYCASVSVTSFQVTSGRSFAVGTDDKTQVVQHDAHGKVLAQTSEPVGTLADVAPKKHALPQLPGNPPPKTEHVDGGT